MWSSSWESLRGWTFAVSASEGPGARRGNYRGQGCLWRCQPSGLSRLWGCNSAWLLCTVTNPAGQTTRSFLIWDPGHHPVRRKSLCACKDYGLWKPVMNTAKNVINLELSRKDLKSWVCAQALPNYAKNATAEIRDKRFLTHAEAKGIYLLQTDTFNFYVFIPNGAFVHSSSTAVSIWLVNHIWGSDFTGKPLWCR